MQIYDELVWRGLIKDESSPELKDLLNKGGMTFYIGTDPTGDSMHIGHFSSFLISKRLKNAGHNPILLVGGGTGLIGDPKPEAERPMITVEEVQHNYECLKKQAEDIFGFEVVNNYDWLKDFSYIDWLRDVGKYFNIGYMLNKDIVRRRLDEGITYTEFSYMTMQAYDFLHLYQTRNVTLQVAGQDQWGNITAGIELIRKKLGKEVYGFTMPLLTKADGQKFGKTNGKAIWLDINKTSAYEMYQFFINSEDDKVIDYLKFLTFLSKEEIEALEVLHREHPEQRAAHKALAREVITFLHGEAAYESAVRIAETFFKGNLKDLSYEELKQGTADLEKHIIPDKAPLINTLVAIGACHSNREARELISGSSISVNGEKVTDLDYALNKEDAFNNELTIIKKGKKYYYAINFE
ncbi:MAG: tyrosine--tRNA ligase [Erysipelotrichaceae bacterium]|nr:tyrosine--tRNA ligase [Erysipelotrichaceae bacterium]